LDAIGGRADHVSTGSPRQNSLQWSAFARTIKRLQSQKNDVVVVFGPFNEHIIAPENKAVFETLCSQILATKKRERKVDSPKALASELYADASHPLTQGYATSRSRFSRNSPSSGRSLNSIGCVVKDDEAHEMPIEPELDLHAFRPEDLGDWFPTISKRAAQKEFWRCVSSTEKDWKRKAVVEAILQRLEFVKNSRRRRNFTEDWARRSFV